MTDEGEKDTEGFIKSTGASYAYAYDKGGKLKSWFGVSGIPAAFLVDPSGKIVWSGHPGNLDPKTIEKHLAGALPKPLWDWSAGAKDVKAALLKRKYAAALAAAEKLSEADDGPNIRAAIQSIVASRTASMKKALADGDFLSASTAADALVKDFDGLPEKADAAKVAEEVKANKDADRVIKAQKAIRDLQGQRLGKRKELDKAIEDVEKIKKDLAGTYAAKEAEEFLVTLNKKKRKAD